MASSFPPSVFELYVIETNKQTKTPEWVSYSLPQALKKEKTYGFEYPSLGRCCGLGTKCPPQAPVWNALSSAAVISLEA